MLDILKILFCVPFLLYSCYSDIKTRRVTNKLWLIMIISSLFIIYYNILTDGSSYLLHLLISSGSILILVYALFQLGTFGGADAKLLIVLSLILPAYPTLQAFGYAFPMNKPLVDLFALGVLGNAVLLTIIVPIGLAIFNIMKMGLYIDKPMYIFIGYKTKISELTGKHIKLIQDFEMVNGMIKFHFKRGGKEINENIIIELKALSKEGFIKDEVWVTPSLPFMIPLTVGFFVAIFYGDLILELTKYFLFK